MSIDSLVSMITPCYNSGPFIRRLLESVLSQSYKNIEMIVVDDGSTDDTAEIVKSYIEKFNKKGYRLFYYYQENSGQSVAISRGLNKISGEYLVWPDSDDFYNTNDAIEKMVGLLSSSDTNVSCVRCESIFLDERDLHEIGVCRLKKDQPYRQNIFEACLFVSDGFWFGAGNYMMKIDVLKKTIPQLKIYLEKDAGQNWQLMLPALYRHDCITVKEILYSIIVRENSHSRGLYSTSDTIIKKINAYENTIINTLKKIDMNHEEYRKYSERILYKYQLERLRVYIEYNKRNDSLKILNEIVSSGLQVPFVLKMSVLILQLPLGARVISILKRTRILFNR